MPVLVVIVVVLISRMQQMYIYFRIGNVDIIYRYKIRSMLLIMVIMIVMHIKHTIKH